MVQHHRDDAVNPFDIHQQKGIGMQPNIQEITEDKSKQRPENEEANSFRLFSVVFGQRNDRIRGEPRHRGGSNNRNNLASHWGQTSSPLILRSAPKHQDEPLATGDAAVTVVTVVRSTGSPHQGATETSSSPTG